MCIRDEAIQARSQGLTRFESTFPCVKGHGTLRQAANGLCVVCARESGRRSDAKRKRDPEERARAQRKLLAQPEKREKHREHVRARRAQVASDIGRYAATRVRELFTLQKGRCANCRDKLGNKWDVDHVMPRILGGTDDLLNLQLLCASCNRRKGGKHPIDFAAREGRLL